MLAKDDNNDNEFSYDAFNFNNTHLTQRDNWSKVSKQTDIADALISSLHSPPKTEEIRYFFVFCILISRPYYRGLRPVNLILPSLE